MAFIEAAALLGTPLLLFVALVKFTFFQRVERHVHANLYRLPPLKTGASTHMNMGLRKFESLNWLTIDENYLPEHKVRLHLLSEHASSVLQCLPGSESACHEALFEVTSFLTRRYPHIFVFSGSGNDKSIHNLLTGESFRVVNSPCPLEIAAKLAMEDFNLLMKDPSTGEYRLQASATLFPAGWRLEDRIGYTLTELHCPVPAWKDKLGPHVNRYFDHLTGKTAMERHTLFIQTTSDLFQNESLCSSREVKASPPGETDNKYDENHGITSTNPNDASHEKALESSDVSRSSDSCSLSDIYVRRERQTFTRLSTSDAVLFTVRTFMTPLSSLGDKELTALVEQANGWSNEMAAYKGRKQWWNTVLQYYEKRKCNPDWIGSKEV